MTSAYYNPIASGITVTYKCPKCEQIVESHQLDVPQPNYYAERATDSENSEDYEVVCSNCDASTPAYLYTRYDGGLVEMPEAEIMGIEEDYPIEDTDYDYEAEFFEQSREENRSLLDKLSGLDSQDQQTLYQLLFVNIIARMEAYLGDTFKREVLKDEASIRMFVENYKPYGSITISLSNLFKTKDDVAKRIAADLRKFLYHNLDKLKPMFRDILKIDIGNISKLMPAVNKRHHIVHRNGKDHDGNPITITREDIDNLSQEVSELIDRIESALNPS